MRVGLVRNVAFGMVALVGLGLAGCDDNPTDFEPDETVRIFANPTVMTVPAGVTTLLQSRTENAGNEPTWEEITASVDGSCGSGAITVDVAADFEPTIEPSGKFDVTGGTTWGESCIQLSGGGASATIEVNVVADSLEITGTPPEDELVLFESVQLSTNLLSDDGSAVGPFDPATDIVWTTDTPEEDPPVVTVDATGLVTAVGPGTAEVTATWTELGVSVSASTTIIVVVPPPALTSTDVASAEVGEVVTITGSGMVEGVHSIFVDGLEVDEFLEPTIVDPTTATFRMPGGATGPTEITVGVVGEVSNALEVERLDSTEPLNDDPVTGPVVALPVDMYGFTDAADTDDFFTFTLAAETTFDLFLDWESGADMDVIIWDDATLTSAVCAAASTAHPEETECTLPAGTYVLQINDYDAVAATYIVQLTE